jgi:regulator of protease activity HflC (stomatin/prohibitin superfamily)
MPTLFVSALVIGAIAVIILIIGFLLRRRTAFAIVPGIGVLVFAGLLLLSSCLTQVPAQNTGVATQFGRPTGQIYGAGIHWKSPVTKVTDMDGTIQQIDNEGDARTTVRLNNNSLMYVQNNLRWRINPDAAPQLFVDWKKFDHIEGGLVSKELNAALNVVLADYDALDPGKTGQSNDQLAQKVIDRLNERIGRNAKDFEIEIITFTIQRIDFDEATQKRLNQYQEQVAETRTAQEREKTAQAEARANKALSESVNNDPNVLVSKCLDIQSRAVDKGLNPNFNCWPINGATVTTPAGRR